MSRRYTDAEDAALIEDVEWMLDTGCTDPEVIATRLADALGYPVTLKSLEMRLRRTGRGDLMSRMPGAWWLAKRRVA